MCDFENLIIYEIGKIWKFYILIETIFSLDFVEMAAFIACNASAKLPILNQCRVRVCRLDHYSRGSNGSYYSLCLSLFLSKGARKQKIIVAVINVVINLYQYFCFEIFFFQNFQFSKFCKIQLLKFSKIKMPEFSYI